MPETQHTWARKRLTLSKMLCGCLSYLSLSGAISDNETRATFSLSPWTGLFLKVRRDFPGSHSWKEDMVISLLCRRKTNKPILESVKEKCFWGQGNQSRNPDASGKSPEEWQCYLNRCCRKSWIVFKVAYLIFRGENNTQKWIEELFARNNCIVLDKLLGVPYLE